MKPARTDAVGVSIKFVAARAWFVLVSMIIGVWLARVAGSDAFGRYVTVVTFLVWLEMIAGGLNPHIMKMAARKEHYALRILRRHQLVLAVVTAVSLYAASDLLASLLKSRSLAPLFRVAALDIVPYALFISNVTILNGIESYRRQWWAQIIYALGKMVFMGSGILLTGDVLWPLIGMVLASLTAWVISSWWMESHSIYKKMRKASADYRVPVTTYIFSLLLVAGLAVSQGIDLWFLQWWCANAETVGLYASAHNIVRVMYFGTSAMMAPLLPAVAQSGSFLKTLKSRPDLRHVVSLIIAGLIASSIFLSVFGKFLIGLLYGEDFLEAAVFLRYLAPAYALVVCGFTGTGLVFFSGKMGLAAALRCVSPAVFTTGALIGVSQTGVMGIPVALGITGLTLVIINIVLFMRPTCDTCHSS